MIWFRKIITNNAEVPRLDLKKVTNSELANKIYQSLITEINQYTLMYEGHLTAPWQPWWGYSQDYFAKITEYVYKIAKFEPW